jgi:hypothetical protein
MRFRGLKMKKGSLQRALIGAAIGTVAAGLISYGNAAIANPGVPIGNVGELVLRSALGGGVGGALAALATTDRKNALVTSALGGVAGLTIYATMKRALLPGAAGMTA